MAIPSGLYRTEGGSILDLHVGPDGAVTGFYSTALGQPEAGNRFPLSGAATGDLVGFVVAWEGHHSLTSWCGRYANEGGRGCLRTMWHLARAYKDAAHKIPAEPWESFLTYTTTFYKD